MSQSFTFYYIGIGLLLLFIAVVIIAIFRIRERKERERYETKDYIKALNALIEGDYASAINFFYRTVQMDTENIDAYLKLGDIFRALGKVDKAIKIHKELLVRRHLDQMTRTEITRSLVLDYISGKFYDEALERLNELFAIEPRNIWAKKQQLIIYEAKTDWDNAFKTLRVLAKWEERKDHWPQLALYRVEEAQKLFRKDREKEGRIRLREAIKIDPHCAAAPIALGDSYVRENRYTDAIKIWMEFVKKMPSHSYLVFDRLQEVLYSVGSYGEIENILQELTQEHPENLDVLFALSDIHLRKGDLNGAIELCEAALEKASNSVPAKMKLIKLYARKGQRDKALQIALELADRTSDSERKYQCSACRFESSAPLWHCPKCGAWKSFKV